MRGPGRPCYAALLPFAFRAFETQMTRLEAEFVRREAPPSYGQLIAQGLIPPVEDFPVYSASQVSSEGNETYSPQLLAGPAGTLRQSGVDGGGK